VPPDVLPTVALVAFVLAAAFTDLRSRRIPNALTYPCIVFGCAFHALGGAWSSALLGLAFGFGLLLLLALLVPGALGMGDVKMAAAIGALGGFPFVVDALLWGMAFGGVGALVTMAARRRLGLLLRRVRALLEAVAVAARAGGRVHLAPRADAGAEVPFGVALAAGTLFVLLRGGLA